MPSAPQRRERPRRPPPLVPVQERRESSSERGYGWAWTKYADAIRRERVFCELCMEAYGIETPCAGQTTTETGRKRSQGVVDHVIPVGNAGDPLFWEESNHWVLCVPCNAFKSLNFDGTYGKRKIHATSRDAGGIARRRRDVIEARRKSSL